MGLKLDMYSATEFVIHEHRAKRAGLHYDLRIRVGDVLKDWAFRKPIPLENGIKRLGIEQPDHHPSWLEFEGEIKDGYGAGELRIWDRGVILEFKYENDKLEGIFSGQRIEGKYLLMKSKKIPGWLFFKVD